MVVSERSDNLLKFQSFHDLVAACSVNLADVNLSDVNLADAFVSIFMDLSIPPSTHWHRDDVSKMYGMDKPLSPVPHVFRVALIAYKNLLHSHKNQVCNARNMRTCE